LKEVYDPTEDRKQGKSPTDTEGIKEKIKNNEVRVKGKPKKNKVTEKAKSEKEKKAKEAKPKVEKSPLRKITISRTTIQITIPGHVRDKMLKALDIDVGEIQKLKGFLSDTVWDDKSKAAVVRFVPAGGK
jgi:hypothetical protein